MKRNFLTINRFKEIKTPNIKVVEKDNVEGLHSGDHVIMVNENNQVGSHIIRIEYIVYKEGINLVYFKYIDKLPYKLRKIYWKMFKDSNNK